MVSITYNKAQDDTMGRHDGIATIRCLNASAYTTWCTQKAVPLLGRLVDFMPHRRSMSGTAPVASARSLDERPTRVILQDALTAFKNETPHGPTLTQIRNSIQEGVDSLQSRLTSLSFEINQHTSTVVDAAASTQQLQHQHLLQQLTLLTTASSDYSKHMSGISSALLAGPLQMSSNHPPGLTNPPGI